MSSNGKPGKPPEWCHQDSVPLEMLILQKKARVRLGVVYQNMQMYSNIFYSGTELEGIMHENMYVLKQSLSYLNRMTMNWSILYLWCGLPAYTMQLFPRRQSRHHHEFKLPSIFEYIIFLHILNIQFLRFSCFNLCNNRPKKEYLVI